MPLSVGDKLGPYEILAPIGKGGMGEVYRARDPRLNRDVAIKVSAAQFSERFEREAKAIAALNHPNICQVYDIGPNYLVMEFIEGTPLARPLPLEVALRHAAQIADALSAAHAKGITHRDLKPANILVTSSGIKLLDFGLALLTGDGSGRERAADETATIGLTQVGTILGTAAYMSPEQAEAKHVDARSDIFSFGLVLYEMLSGRRAFTGDSAIAIMAAILQKEPEPLDTTPALQSILARCLRKPAAERFQTMAEVRTALEQASTKPVEKRPSIAVLPFANMSADKENEYFSDGLAEEILNLLAKIPGLKVIARTSSFAFRGKEQDITKIAEALRVQHILEGSVRKAGNRIRVTAQLIHAADGTHLWSERYDRDMTDVFAVQDEIGQAISEALQVRLAPRTPVVNIEAWQLCLKGEYHRQRYTPESLAKAKEYFEQALAIDPNYAHAHNMLAMYYYMLGLLGIKPVGEMAPLVKATVSKALVLDPANSESHGALAVVAAAVDYDWKTAENYLRKAMAVEPFQTRLHYVYALYYLLPLRRVPDAMERSRLALESDPLSMLLHFGVAWCLYCARQYPESIECAQRALEIDPNYYINWLVMGLAQLGAGKPQEAMSSIQRVTELAPWWSTGGGILAAVCYQAGDRERGERLARELADSQNHTLGAASYYAAASQADAMFEALDGAYQQRDAFLIYVQSLPFFDPYRADPRFQALLRRMNLA